MTVAFYARHIEPDNVLQRGLIFETLKAFKYKASHYITEKYLAHGNVIHAPVVTRKYSIPGMKLGDADLQNQCQDSPHLLRGHQI